MVKNKKGAPGMGRALIKSRFGAGSGRKFIPDKTMLHTTEVRDGYDWGRLNLQSVTEESSFQEFLATAELTDKEFRAEKLDVKILGGEPPVGVLSAAAIQSARRLHDKHRDFLKIPRRPKWDKDTTPEELDKAERELFLEWRRGLALLQENEGVILTPYEKNLQFWRQLWRVIERSDVVVQIVDARNPLLFRSEDLETYVRETSPHKINMVLVNKADFLTDTQRRLWAEHFAGVGVKAVFFSAKLAAEAVKESEAETSSSQAVEDEEEEGKDKQDRLLLEELRVAVEKLDASVEQTGERLKNVLAECGLQNTPAAAPEEVHSEIVSREQLLQIFRTVHLGPKVTPDVTTVGFIGYPNVGKSSTINAILMDKKVSVSATPGKTKHFQTLFVDRDLLLCDCPGLVLPSFVFTKAEMVLNGILPIDQMRDHVPPVTMVAELVPRRVIEDKYGIMLPVPSSSASAEGAPSCEEVLDAYSYSRGFMTAHGQPDNPRGARYILKDFMNGELLYCHAPPGVPQESFHTWPERTKEPPLFKRIMTARQHADKSSKASNAEMRRDKEMSTLPQVHTLGRNIDGGSHKNNRRLLSLKEGKKEKLRRRYAHLDEH